MKNKLLSTACAAAVAGLFAAAPGGATPPANPNASCVGQSVSFFIPTKLVHPYGPIVAGAVQAAEPNAGQQFVKPEATATHDECEVGG